MAKTKSSNAEAKMLQLRRSTSSIQSLAILVILVACISCSKTTGRSLRSIQETREGGNATFDCSPSGPCVPCSTEEKSDDKYLCGETGYRIRLKCVQSESKSKVDKSKEGGGKKTRRRSTIENADLQRRLQDSSSKAGDDSNSYDTYRSCIPGVDEEKLSVLGFEALMVALFVSSGLFVIFRRQHGGAAAAGSFVRIPTGFR